MFDKDKRYVELRTILYSHFDILDGDEDIYLKKVVENENLMIEPLIYCIKLYYEHCKNNHQINGINETAKKLLEVL